MLNYLTTPPGEPQLDDLDSELNRFKYPNIVCELLTFECWKLLDIMVQPATLKRLFAVLDQETPLHPLTGSFLLRIVNVLLVKRTEEVG